MKVEPKPVDVAGNSQSYTNRAGDTITFGHDKLNRITTKTYPDTSEVKFVYDALGKFK